MTGITFAAIFKRVTTTVDGGWSLTISVDASEATQMMQLSQFRDQLLQVAIVPVDLAKSEPVEALDI